MAENAQIVALRKLGLTDEEITEVLADDKKVDRGEKLWELTDEQKKVAKAMTVSDTKTKKAPTVYKFEKKTNRKENTTKSAIIAEIANFLTEKGYDLVEITNKERQIAFKVGENDYELTLVQKRKPKK
ncbi:MAG: hypothetical protein IKB70_08225 [Bacilli bacterium]|nr:hypothetical protein [Bacilli bacterium]